MKTKEVLNILSQCGIGAVIIDQNKTIIQINSAGEKLMCGRGVVGESLEKIAPCFCETTQIEKYCNISFGEYLKRCPSPEVTDLKGNTQLIVFQDARNDACHDMLIQVVNHVSDSVILCDEHNRVFLLNDTAVKMDTLLMDDVSGNNINEIYTAEAEELLLPRAIRERKPLLNIQQSYITKYGKRVDILCDTYPIIMDGKIKGAFSIMKDYTRMDSLSRKILELQEELLETTATKKVQGDTCLKPKWTFKDIIYCSDSMNFAINNAKLCAKSDSNVLICGETGTGKELLSQSIHNASSRADKPFLAVNCSAIPENLLESLLFGTEKGAYTGAENKKGLFEQATGGTLLFDEINSMPIQLQPKLLRVLQDGVVRRIGGTREIKTDCRIIANMNIPIEEAIKENRIRQDLFYRLGVFNLSVPPLRQRPKDIPLLIKCFILEYNKTMQKDVEKVSSDAMEVFLSYNWPGNVRELQHAIEYAMNIIPKDGKIIDVESIPAHITKATFTENNEDVVKKGMALEINEVPQRGKYIHHKISCETIMKVLEEKDFNITKAATCLGISRQNLQYLLKRYGINVQKLKGKI